jgi:molybdopterin synthase sulfur carrier subunit
MVVKVWIPPQLRSVRQFPALAERVLDDNGRVRPYLNIYLNDEDIRFLQGDSTPVKDGDESSIIPEIGGGTDMP